MRDTSELDTQLLDLLVEWEERKAAGTPVTPEDLCRHCPDRVDDLRGQVEQIARLDPFFDRPGAGRPAAPEIPGFELLDEIGRGGMGAVYRARDRMLDRIVAVKVPFGPAVSRKRFEREVQILAKLRHPNIVPVHSAGFAGDTAYLVMQHIAGGSLAERMTEVAGTPEQVAVLMERVARSVAHAHAAGIIHRDLKPSNILIDETGQPFVSDFGVAALLAGEPLVGSAGDTPNDHAPERTRLTGTGVAVGTPAYAAPEARSGGASQPTPAADVWSIGVILYECLTGQLPYPAGGDRSRPPPRPRTVRPTVPRGLEAVTMRCLAIDPAERYPTAAAVAVALARWNRSQSRRALVGRVGLAALLVAAALTGGRLLAWPADAEDTAGVWERDAAVRLQRGEPVGLVPDARPQPAYRVRLGGEHAKVVTHADGSLTAVGHPALVELLPDPGADQYQIVAEIRQDGFFNEAAVGLYFGHQVYDTPEGSTHVFGVLRFSDYGPLARQQQGPNGTRLSLAACDYVCLTPPVLTGRDMRINTGPTLPYEPPDHQGRPPGPWRTLTLDVTRQTTRPTFDGRPMGTFPVPRAQAWADLLPTDVKRLNGTPVLLSPAGGIGLYVSSGEATIRRLSINPLPRQ